eukprot:jgi/Tetstr1/428916/TSEL_018892.t1
MPVPPFKRVFKGKEELNGIVDALMQHHKKAGGIIKHNTNAVKNRMAFTGKPSPATTSTRGVARSPGQEGQAARPAIG